MLSRRFNTYTRDIIAKPESNKGDIPIRLVASATIRAVPVSFDQAASCALQLMMRIKQNRASKTHPETLERLLRQHTNTLLMKQKM